MTRLTATEGPEAIALRVRRAMDRLLPPDPAFAKG